jgi:hypothetical protein
VLNVDANNRGHLYTVYERCQSAAAIFDAVLTAARNGLPTQVPERNREHVRTLMDWLDLAIGTVRRYPRPRDGVPDPRSAPWRVREVENARHAIRVAVVAHSALTVFYGGDHESMATFSETVLGAGRYFQFSIRGQKIPVEKVRVFSLALVESLLKQSRGWLQAEDPLAYIAMQTRYIAADEAEEEASPADTVRLEDIVDTPNESAPAGVTLERIHAFDALKDEARRRGLHKVIIYIEMLESALAEGIGQREGYRGIHRWIRGQTGWNKFKASDVRRQFERLRDFAAEFMIRGVVSEASIMWFWETLHGGERGREHGTWTLKKPPREQ